MAEPKSSVTLEEVRERFLAAEARLGDTSNAIAAIEHAAERLGESRESLAIAGTAVSGLAGRFGEVADALTTNAENLRQGVDAIRMGDPAAIRRQIEELDAAFTAMQSVMGERLGKLEAALVASAAAAAARETIALRERRLIAAMLGVLVVVAIVVGLVR